MAVFQAILQLLVTLAEFVTGLETFEQLVETIRGLVEGEA
jgi:hypothetical protein